MNFSFQCFSRYGRVLSAKVIYDIVTGKSQSYGFVEMSSESEARACRRYLNETLLNGRKLFVDFEVCRVMKGWKPRRLGIPT